MSERDEVYDVAIVGAGAAGLAAAFALQAEGKRVLLLEGESRVGGRVWTHETHRGLDFGAAYFGPLQSYTMRFTEMLEIPRIDNALSTTHWHRTEWSNKERPIFSFKDDSFGVPDDAIIDEVVIRPLLQRLGLLAGFADPPSLVRRKEAIEEKGPNEQALFDTLATIERLVLAIRTRLEDPWSLPFAKVLDDQSVHAWMANNVPNELVRDLLGVAVRAALSAEPEEVSMFYLLYYTATGGSFVNVMAVGRGADSFRFKKGAEELPGRLAALVTSNPQNPVTLLMNSPVVRLADNGDVVQVYGANSEEPFRARRVIIATTPLARNRILDSVRPGAMEMGRTIKVFACFKDRWWRNGKGGFSGYALSARNDAESPVVWTMDNTWEDTSADGTNTQHSCLMGFIVGKMADQLEHKTPEERRAAVFGHWARMFESTVGDIESQLVPNKYFEGVWGRASRSGGCPAAFFKPGQFVPHGAELRRPNGRVHFAGAETATDWVGGYLNGALQSGIRAAVEVVAAEMA